MVKAKGHMISFAARMLIVVAVAVSVSVAVTISLVEHGMTWKSYGITWNIVPVVILTVVLPATLGVVANYLYWRPRYNGEASRHEN